MRDYINYIREQYNNNIKFINNLINSARRDKFASCTTIKVLLDNLKDKGYGYNYKIDEIGYLSHILFAHPKLIEL